MKIPKISGEIEYKELHKLLKKGLGRKAHIYLVDAKYQLIEKSEMERFLKEDKTDLLTYVPEYFDCDDFSFRLMGQFSTPGWGGIAFGISFSKVHAFNIFVDAQKKIWILEPQSNNVGSVDDIKKLKKKVRDGYLPVIFVLM